MALSVPPCLCASAPQREISYAPFRLAAGSARAGEPRSCRGVAPTYSFVTMRSPGLFLFLLCLPLALTSAADWSGTITLKQSMIGPANVVGADKSELDDYTKLLKERLARTQVDLTTASKIVARTLRADIGVYTAELERVALAHGGELVIGSTVFVIDRQRVAVLSDLPRLVVDRATNQALVMGAEKPEEMLLAPMPVPIAIEASAPEVPFLGFSTRRIEVKAEDKKFTVLVAPSLPNPYAMCLSVAAGEATDSLNVVLASLPGMPVKVESSAGDVILRWIVLDVVEEKVDQAAFKP